MTDAHTDAHMDKNSQYVRMVEALLFASAKPLGLEDLADRVPEDVDVAAIVEALRAHYDGRGVNLVEVAGKWMFRTATDLAFLLRKELEEPRKLSRAAVETLAIIAYHQPVTRAEIEDVRGVAVSKGTLDVLMQAGWVRPRGRRQTPGRPATYGTTEDFLVHFGLESVKDLPGLEELKAAGLLDNVNVGLVDFSLAGEQSGDREDEDQSPLPEMESSDGR